MPRRLNRARKRLRETMRQSACDYDYRDFLRLKVGQYYDLAQEVYNRPRDVPFRLGAKLQFAPGSTNQPGQRGRLQCLRADASTVFNIGLSAFGQRKRTA
ncbi:MAG: hypothetical protein MZV70_50755 [Desulfobacterales bacterium]|nr:hypothetical protein [Desulfobacterales bacterium]